MSLPANLVCLFLGLIITVNCFNPNNMAPKANGELIQQEISAEREMANRLLHRLMDIAYETFKDIGGSEQELKEVEKKRALITTCYFQAITCF